MSFRSAHPRQFALVGALLSTLLAGPVFAHPAATTPPPGVTVKALQTAPLTDTDKKQVVLNAVTMEPGTAVNAHTHPGDCIGTVIEGTVDLLIEGREPRRMVAGDSYSNPRGLVHQFRNVGTTPARLVNLVVADKGAPPTQPGSFAPKQ